MLLTVFIYASIIAFIGISLYKAYQYAKMPMHGRWELYPVPKEPGEKGHYGGSYYEDLEWWNKPRQVSHSGEIIDMMKEMLFIKNLFVNQRHQWWLSYALHLGIYLLGLWTVLLAVGAVMELSGIPLTTAEGVSASFAASMVYYITFISGSVGALLVAFGSISLFLKRMFNETFSKYTTPQEYFNLFFIFAVVISGLMVWSADPGFNYGREIMKGLFTFSPIQADGALTAHIILLGVLLIYIPQTKMSHYVGKYFAFHKILWDNEPNLRNSKMEEVIKGAISYKPKASWSAPHIKPPAPAPKDEK
ncbi:respiratory nitrate reductase subunit gamma [Desulforamulus aquiferis]|uniref:Respiratory nitrate reductase subunit gamma n=1 Tax=Desulforamulus aquiferis TaxID=1397668 RepID=A0AAW7ZEQ9_9FIRM|nr:respiratory nitrate reductase subunit gamma [Desulforamulus aquiferis]MDO7787762.1 respiratory nitrate reductase subunit gamma [Desulforamulus aquiferis]RYD05117.1 nitrate reductase subunit gamma [Desulforamulus aquiferis]